MEWTNTTYMLPRKWDLGRYQEEVHSISLCSLSPCTHTPGDILHHGFHGWEGGLSNMFSGTLHMGAPTPSPISKLGWLGPAPDIHSHRPQHPTLKLGRGWGRGGAKTNAANQKTIICEGPPGSTFSLFPPIHGPPIWVLSLPKGPGLIPGVRSRCKARGLTRHVKTHNETHSFSVRGVVRITVARKMSPFFRHGYTHSRTHPNRAHAHTIHHLILACAMPPLRGRHRPLQDKAKCVRKL